MDIIKPAQRGLSPEAIELMKRHLETIVGYYPNCLGSLVIVGIGLDGNFSRATRISKDCFLGETLLPSVVAEILRRDVAESVANEVVSNRL